MYFSNGTEGDVFQSKYCYECVNWRDLKDGLREGCPVWDLHIAFNYKQFDNNDTELCLNIFGAKKSIKGVSFNKCRMFLKER